MAQDVSGTVVLIAYLFFFAIGIAIKARGLRAKARSHRFGALEAFSLIAGLTGIGLPILWLATSALEFADYRAHLLPLVVGSLAYALGLWLLGHVALSLGKFWSPTLQLKEDHQLVTTGVYRLIRHPMYLALLVFAAGNALVLPNYVAGPTLLVAVLFVMAFRIGAEERMLLEEFGSEYEAYCERSHRLIPGVW